MKLNRRLVHRTLVAAGLILAATMARAQLVDCTSNPVPGCLYAPPALYSVDRSEAEIVYTDIAGAPRHVLIAIRRPLGAAGPLPVVVWSHGGAEGHRNPRRSMAEWSEVTAQAGYLTISLAHAPRDENPNTPDNSRRSLCEAVAAVTGTSVWDLTQRETCRHFKYLNWDRPHDLRAVLDELERLNRSGPLAGQVDLERIALAGHSAGSGGVLTTAGALRNFTGSIVDLADPRRRPAAVIALSPQQPGSEGLFDTDRGRALHSWARLGIPVLFATGDGDSTCHPIGEPGSCFGDQPYGRRIPFERVPAGNKYLLYLQDANVFHTLYALETSAGDCTATPQTQQRCDATARVLRATALAFLDAHLLARPLAQRWLAGQDVVTATGGVAQWENR